MANQKQEGGGGNSRQRQDGNRQRQDGNRQRQDGNRQRERERE